MKKLFLLAALCVAAAFSSCSKHDNVEPAVVPDPQPLAIAFAEGNSLQFDVDETKTVHYSITGGSDKTVVKVEMQNPDGAYALSTTQTSSTEGTIKITAKTPTENCVLVTVSDGDQSITAEIAVSTNATPEKDKLAITFAEGNSLQFDVNETKTVHYTITGGSDKTVVTAELQTPDDAYTVKTTPASATEGTIAITAKMPSIGNSVLVSVSDSDRSITATIDVAVTLKASFDGKTVVVETPGTLSQLLAGYDTTKIKELTVIGNLNDKDIATLKNLKKLAILDMEHANLEELPANAFAFYQNISLTSVKLPLTLKTIGSCAFYQCSSLTSVTIGNSVTSIGEGAFYGCSSLTSVAIPDSVTSIGIWAFYGCSSLTSITIGNNVTSIDNQAFQGCSSLTSITIPDSVTEIGDGAFISCTSLTSVTIGNSVTEIGGYAFQYCSSLTNITIPDSVTTIGRYAFSDCSGLTSVTIPDSVTTIGYGAFYDCSGLTSVTIPDSVTTIGDSAFAGCSRLTAFYGKFASSDNRCLIIDGRLAAFAPAGLTSYTIPDGVISIGEDTFADCSSLTSVTIPDSVTEIGNSAFYDCTGLKTICCKATVAPSVGSYAFSGVRTMLTLYVPTGCKAAYAAADGWSRFTTIIETEL